MIKVVPPFDVLGGGDSLPFMKKRASRKRAATPKRVTKPKPLDPSVQQAISRFDDLIAERVADDAYEFSVDADVRKALMVLSARQRAFVVCYMWPGSPTRFEVSKSAEAVGLKTGSAYMANPLIRRAFSMIEAQLLRHMAIDAEWVMNESIKLYQEARHLNDRREARQLLEMIGKHKHVDAFDRTVEVIDPVGERLLAANRRLQIHRGQDIEDAEVVDQ